MTTEECLYQRFTWPNYNNETFLMYIQLDTIVRQWALYRPVVSVYAALAITTVIEKHYHLETTKCIFSNHDLHIDILTSNSIFPILSLIGSIKLFITDSSYHLETRQIGRLKENHYNPLCFYLPQD